MSKRTKRNLLPLVCRGESNASGRTPVLGVSGSGHMDEGGFEQPISDAERKAKILGPPELSGADSARQKGPSTVWPLPETLNTFGRDCARLNLILWSSDLTQGSRQRSVEGGPHPHLRWEASAARDYRLAKPAEVENEAIPSSSRWEQTFRIGARPLEKRAP